MGQAYTRDSKFAHMATSFTALNLHNIYYLMLSPDMSDYC